MYERVTSLTEMQSDSSPLGYVEERWKHPVTPSPRHPSFYLWMLRHRGVARALRDHKSTCAQVTGWSTRPRHPVTIPSPQPFFSAHKGSPDLVYMLRTTRVQVYQKSLDIEDM